MKKVIVALMFAALTIPALALTLGAPAATGGTGKAKAGTGAKAKSGAKAATKM